MRYSIKQIEKHKVHSKHESVELLNGQLNIALLINNNEIVTLKRSFRHLFTSLPMNVSILDASNRK